MYSKAEDRILPLTEVCERGKLSRRTIGRAGRLVLHLKREAHPDPRHCGRDMARYFSKILSGPLRGRCLARQAIALADDAEWHRQ